MVGSVLVGAFFYGGQYELMQRSLIPHRLAFDVPSVHLWGNIPQFTLAGISEWMAACTVLY